MSTHRQFDKICYAVFAAMLLLAVFFLNAEHFGVVRASRAAGYESRLFDTSKVHTVDIVMDDWEGFLKTCENEEYSACSVVIDGEAFHNVAIRAKGNTSLTQVRSYGNGRYSFKIEFDHYDGGTYHGLDKLCLNNIIQDNTYMKDYVSYEMMRELGVAAPLCSFAALTVNGESRGLYLALEGVEEAFLNRNYGNDYGQLYKPDSMNMGGGRGNGRNFDQQKWEDDGSGKEADAAPPSGRQNGDVPPENRPDAGGNMPDMEAAADDRKNRGMPNPEDFPDREGMPEPGGALPGNGGMPGGSDDVLLNYIDDDPDSYRNIFDNAKTGVTTADQQRLIAALKGLSDGKNIEETVDVEQVIRYFVVHNFVLNFDSYTGSMIHNYYLYEKNGQLTMLPWDYNLAFGGFEASESVERLINYPIDTPVSGKSVEERPMLAWIFADEAYTELYHTYFDTLLSEYFESGQFSQMMDETRALIAPYVEDDPTKFCTYEEFVAGADTLKQFCLLRAESVRAQLDGTIARTSDAQDESTFVDAGGLKLSAMGTMDMGRNR